ncbi:DUF3604 domain-containing protein [Tamlana haliotis]|uniref:DUF3604 domain-containing protein n=1 Tax=Pseudotamlana haliotis TaxID=2614804 RepID=A0A6N6MFS0_9FLAO|nr:DUF3604 domain-containing protein [Tamlana haliotis]KAB1067789.1 DUF3604 domain-containing protein [Tamlana haliotis]
MRKQLFFTYACLALSLTACKSEKEEAVISESALDTQSSSEVEVKVNPTNDVYWGETHLHTQLSADAGLFGNKLGLDAAYRFAKGEEVTSSTGIKAKINRPLDYLVITDHSDFMGFAEDIDKGAPNVLADAKGKEWYDGMKAGGQAATDAAFNLITTFSQGKMPAALSKDYSPGSEIYGRVWQNCIDAAEAHYNPGEFTTIIGYEWTSLVKGANMHRNVLFRDNGDKASQVEPMVTIAPVGSTDPLDLYAWMKNYEEKTGGSVLAIAHNGNLSNGIMFPVDAQYTGRKLDAKYVEERGKYEPLYEWTQIKGDGEAHPFLSPEDEFADYETWDDGNLDLTQGKSNDMLAKEYAREALKNGLLLEEKFGANPYKFGAIGSTDSHTTLTAVEEDNFYGKHISSEPSPERITEGIYLKTDIGTIEDTRLNSAGYTGVWAESNTREAIYDAMARKEVYASTGPRMTVRFFGGWEYTKDDLNSHDAVKHGYEKGVPMGGDLKPAQGAKAPTFMVSALKDAIGANLDRVQIIKGWLDENGKTHEKIYDVAWSGDRKINSDGRVKEDVGNTINIAEASYENSIGAPDLNAVWTDPDFDPKQPAFYYSRVIEIPTPRWVVYDAKKFGKEIPKGVETSNRERAYTSPIWYNAK